MGTGTDGRTSYDFFFGVYYKKEHQYERDTVRIGHEKVDEDMLLFRAASLPDSDKEKIQELIDSPSGWIYINDGHGIIVKVKNGREQGFVQNVTEEDAE
tara:strand:+ start:5795 stop:6091 length:297 start_codon:yes stop_codon:yes gene_type:complete